MNESSAPVNKLLRVGLVIFALIMLLTIFDSVFRSIQHRGLAKLVLHVAPKDSVVTIDGAITKNHKVLYVKPGSHKISGSKPDFETDSQTIQAKKNTSTDIYLTPSPVSSTALRWAAQHQEEDQERQRLAQIAQSQYEEYLSKNYPLIKYLPYDGTHYYITYGASKKYPNDDHKIAIYISASPIYRQMALDFISGKGLNPSDYEIIYQLPGQSNGD